MSYTIYAVVFFVAFAKAQENNQLCPCDTEADKKDNADLWELLKKLSVDVTKDNEELYAVPAGNLFQFDCSRCDEKLRKKRRIMLPNESDIIPEEVEHKKKENTEEDDEVRDKRNVIHPKFKFQDLRCPKNTVWVAHTCVSLEEFDDESEDK